MENLQTSSTTDSASTAGAFNPNAYTAHRGEPVNIINDLTILSELSDKPVNAYGANVTVQYILPIFPKISFNQGNIPVMNIGNFDYITLEITIPSEVSWFDTHNLLHFSSYFFSSKKNRHSYTILGSLDDSLFFTTKEDIQKGKTIKVCITASKAVAAYFESRNWYISRIPADYNQAANESTYNCVVRLGTLKHDKDSSHPLLQEAIKDGLFIQENVKFTYYECGSADSIDMATFTSDEIQKTAQPTGTVPSTVESDRYDDIKNTMDEQLTLKSGYIHHVVYPYMSNFANPPVHYPIISFYDSIKLGKPVNIQANNTQENYFMSNIIHFDDHNSDDYLHILFANQAALKAALTSNVQVYTSNPNSHGCINWPNGNSAIINTAADLPAFSSDNYPHNDSEDPTQNGTCPVYGIYSVKISDLVIENAPKNPLDPPLSGVIITERFSYNPVNLNFNEYSECHTTKAYVGPALSEAFLQQLQNDFPLLKVTTLAG